MSAEILLLPGDGIGPEVVGQARRIIDWLIAHRGFDATLSEALVGGAALDADGVPMTEETLNRALAADAVLLGAVGGPKWDGVSFEIRPEAALLSLRKELALFANLRPAMVFDALIEASTLKPEIVQGLDILIVRELTGGVYFGEPKGIYDDPDGGGRRGVDTQVYTTQEIHRIADVAFDLAAKRKGKVCSADKANVMQSGRLWREEVTRRHAEAARNVHLSHMLADAMAMQLLRWPSQFDVIVTDNLFGDMLSDEAAMLTGSLGMLPSASLGAPDASGKRKALYEPVHGSAPDIAGENKANPIATIMSVAMMMRYSFDRGADADLIEQAVAAVLEAGYRTGDIMPGTPQPTLTPVGTDRMGDAILAAMAKAAG